jgi:nucleoside-diphosphate kinase
MSETTVILLKPDCCEKNLAGEVIDRFQKAGLSIRACKMIRLSDDLLKEHYSHLADLPFFPEIVEFMQSTPVIAMALSGDDAIAKVRSLLGPTDSQAAEKGTIRGDLGTDKMLNIAHASDTPENAAAEIKRFFGADELF